MLFRNGRSFLVLPHAFGVLFFMALITTGNQLPLPVPIVIYVILRECKLWMPSHMVNMVHYGRPRVYSLILTELAFVFIFRQHFRPQAQPLRTGIEAMQVPALYVRLDINAYCPSSILMSLARSWHMAVYFPEISMTLSKASFRFFPVFGMTFSYSRFIRLYIAEISASSTEILASISFRSMIATSRGLLGESPMNQTWARLLRFCTGSADSLLSYTAVFPACQRLVLRRTLGVPTLTNRLPRMCRRRSLRHRPTLLWKGRESNPQHYPVYAR